MARILVADDEEDIRELIKLVLIRDGHRVVTVADGMAAVEMHQHEVFDLIVSDLRMPRLTRIQVTEEVRANPGATFPSSSSRLRLPTKTGSTHGGQASADSW